INLFFILWAKEISPSVPVRLSQLTTSHSKFSSCSSVCHCIMDFSLVCRSISRHTFSSPYKNRFSTLFIWTIILFLAKITSLSFTADTMAICSSYVVFEFCGTVIVLLMQVRCLYVLHMHVPHFAVLS